MDPTAYMYMADTSPYGRPLFLKPFYPPCLAKQKDFSTANMFDADTFFGNIFDALDMKNGILAAIWGTWGTDRLNCFLPL